MSLRRRRARVDELGGLARPVAELLDQHLEDHAAQALVVDRRGGGDGRGARRHGLEQRELRDLALELRHDVLGLLRPDAGQPAQVGLVLPRDGRGDLAHRRGQRARRHQRAHVLHGDELLEELLVELGGEADQHRARLVLGRMIVDRERDLLARVARAGGRRRSAPAG